MGFGEVMDVIYGIQWEILQGKFEDSEMCCELDLGRERGRGNKIFIAVKYWCWIRLG
jgi:hypothetical protein